MMDHRYDHQCQCPKCSDHEKALKVSMDREKEEDKRREKLIFKFAA